MKRLSVKRLSTDKQPEASQVPALLDKAGVEFQTIDCAPWAADFPYHPEVKFRIALTSEAILLNYQVNEEYVRATAERDNGHVWEDSCCEFFSQPADDGTYYNMECNCMGTLLVGFGATRDNREWAPEHITKGVKRWTSLAEKPGGTIPLQKAEGPWQLALVIPATTFFHHHVDLELMTSLRANFYKCGDKLPQPHFLAWNNIEVPKPDFHRPDFFGVMNIE